MTDHDHVMSVEPIASDTEFLYTVRRIDGPPPVRVHLSDAYEYGKLDYIAKPKEMDRNSFILLALPHAQDVRPQLMQEARSDGIGIGKIGKFMGALRHRDVSQYESPAERQRRTRGGRG